MPDFKKPRTSMPQNSSNSFILFLSLFVLLFPSTVLAQKTPCQNASMHLRGDLDTVMARGGIWTLMEQAEGLKDQSMIGLQVDGKLSRTVGNFETLCETGKNPTKQLFEAIQNILGEARTTFNPSSSSEKLLGDIKTLNTKLDTLLTKFD